MEQAVLPTALDLPDDASFAVRRLDALIVGVITIRIKPLAIVKA